MSIGYPTRGAGRKQETQAWRCSRETDILRVCVCARVGVKPERAQGLIKHSNAPGHTLPARVNRASSCARKARSSLARAAATTRASPSVPGADILRSRQIWPFNPREFSTGSFFYSRHGPDARARAVIRIIRSVARARKLIFTVAPAISFTRYETSARDPICGTLLAVIFIFVPAGLMGALLDLYARCWCNAFLRGRSDARLVNQIRSFSRLFEGGRNLLCSILRKIRFSPRQ